jgi:hypothetical protein
MSLACRKLLGLDLRPIGSIDYDDRIWLSIRRSLTTCVAWRWPCAATL